MSKIIPAILVKSMEEFSQKLKIVRQLTDRLQLDVIDGEFVDNKTIEPNDVGKIGDIKIDAHLMVQDPIKYARQCVKNAYHTIIVQFESKGDVVAAIDYVKDNGLRVGLAINPQTEPANITDLLPKLDHLLVMAYPAGFAGQPFDKKNLQKVTVLKGLKPSLEIGWDGAVSNENISQISQAGVDVINVNSFLFESDNALDRYSQLLGAIS